MHQVQPTSRWGWGFECFLKKGNHRGNQCLVFPYFFSTLTPPPRETSHAQHSSCTNQCAGGSAAAAPRSGPQPCSATSLNCMVDHRTVHPCQPLPTRAQTGLGYLPDLYSHVHKVHTFQGRWFAQVGSDSCSHLRVDVRSRLWTGRTTHLVAPFSACLGQNQHPLERPNCGATEARDCQLPGTVQLRPVRVKLESSSVGQLCLAGLCDSRHNSCHSRPSNICRLVRTSGRRSGKTMTLRPQMRSGQKTERRGSAPAQRAEGRVTTLHTDHPTGRGQPKVQVPHQQNPAAIYGLGQARHKGRLCCDRRAYESRHHGLGSRVPSLYLIASEGAPTHLSSASNLYADHTSCPIERTKGKADAQARSRSHSLCAPLYIGMHESFMRLHTAQGQKDTTPAGRRWCPDSIGSVVTLRYQCVRASMAQAVTRCTAGPAERESYSKRRRDRCVQPKLNAPVCTLLAQQQERPAQFHCSFFARDPVVRTGLTTLRCRLWYMPSPSSKARSARRPPKSIRKPSQGSQHPRTTPTAEPSHRAGASGSEVNPAQTRHGERWQTPAGSSLAPESADDRWSWSRYSWSPTSWSCRGDRQWWRGTTEEDNDYGSAWNGPQAPVAETNTTDHRDPMEGRTEGAAGDDQSAAIAARDTVEQPSSISAGVAAPGEQGTMAADRQADKETMTPQNASSTSTSSSSDTSEETSSQSSSSEESTEDDPTEHHLRRRNGAVSQTC